MRLLTAEQIQLKESYREKFLKLSEYIRFRDLLPFAEIDVTAFSRFMNGENGRISLKKLSVLDNKVKTVLIDYLSEVYNMNF